MTGAARPDDRAAGALTGLVGACTAYGGYQYDIGSFLEMGPGFFPFALGCILLLLGMLIVLNRRAGQEAATDAATPLDVRGALCIVGAIGVFLVMVKYGGLVPAAFATTVIAALGDRTARPFGTLALGVVAVGIGVGLFHFVLRLPLPLFTWG